MTGSSTNKPSIFGNEDRSKAQGVKKSKRQQETGHLYHLKLFRDRDTTRRERRIRRR
jgi:hypothetical protein